MTKAFVFRAAVWLLAGSALTAIVRFLMQGETADAVYGALIALPILALLAIAERVTVFGELNKRDGRILELEAEIDKLQSQRAPVGKEHDDDRDAIDSSLGVLNELAYAFECIAMGHTGEAKTALATLRENLQVAPGLSVGGRKLRQAVWNARQSLVDGNPEEAAQALFLASRSLWSAVTPEEATRKAALVAS